MRKTYFQIFVLILLISVGFGLSCKSESDVEDTLLKGMASYSNVIPEDTKLKISVISEIDALKNQIGDEFSATVLNDLNVNDINIIPVGSTVIGHIEDIQHSGKASMQGSIEISLDKIVLPSGSYIPLAGAKFAADNKYTNRKRSLKGEGNGLAKNIGAGAVKGATLTFIPGNAAVKSAAIGVATTGAVFSGGWSITSTAVIGGLTGFIYGVKHHGKEVMVASGQELEIELHPEQGLNPVELAIDDLMNQGIQTTESGNSVIK